jgi:hypothetical protein
MSTQIWFVIPLVLILLYVLKTSGRHQVALRRGSSLVFGPSREVTLVVIAGVGLGAALIAGPILQTGNIDILTSMIGGAMIIAGLMLLPPVVVLCDEGVEAKWWWGKKIRLHWSSIAAASHDRARHETLIHGRSGTVLRHTQYHVDAARFQTEIARHVKQITEIRHHPDGGANLLRR